MILRRFGWFHFVATDHSSSGCSTVVVFQLPPPHMPQAPGTGSQAGHGPGRLGGWRGSPSPGLVGRRPPWLAGPDPGQPTGGWAVVTTFPGQLPTDLQSTGRLGQPITPCMPQPRLPPSRTFSFYLPFGLYVYLVDYVTDLRLLTGWPDGPLKTVTFPLTVDTWVTGRPVPG